MPRTTDLEHTQPLFIAVRAIFQNANRGDRDPEPGNRTDINREAALLCRRAADELDSRL